jgi:hypothetical protein
MSCGSPIIIGDGCGTEINYGEAIELFFEYRNEDDTPIDLSTSSVSIYSSSPDAIKNLGSVTIVDAVSGKVRFFLSSGAALNLRSGINNRFKIQTVFGDLSTDITPEIYLKVT